LLEQLVLLPFRRLETSVLLAFMNSKISKKANLQSKPWKVASAGTLSTLLFFGHTAPVLGNPTGGEVVTGNAIITNAGTTLNINQGSDKAIINWQNFSISSGELTKFLVPDSSSATLNRVVGGNPSSIYGTLQSNGQLFLVNPNGIVVGAGGRIDTAGFLGSTLDVSNSEFLSGGDLHFLGTSSAGIDNQGTIHAASGDVYLIANQVSNSGTLDAPQGNAGMAAGTDVLLQQAGDQHLFVQPSSAASTATGVTNAGSIQAATAELKAAGGNAYALAINNSGNISVTGFKKVNGQVYLTADGGNITNGGQISAQNSNGDGGTIVLNGHGTFSKGTVLNSGKLVASGKTAGTRGGTVQMLGNQVGIMDHGVVDVSGNIGGGTALIGGDEHGANPNIPDAEQAYVGPDAQVMAGALMLGNGGKIILWGNETTQAYGKLNARGGALGGSGGFVETSAPSLDARGMPDISAPNGKGGIWLLDPSDIFISDFVTTTPGFSAPFTISSGSPFNLNQSDLLAALISGNVILDASGGSGGNGTLTWQQSSSPFDISGISGNTLTLTAPAQIPTSSISPGILLSGITIKSISGIGSLNLVLNNSGASSNVQIINTTLQLNGGNLTTYGTGFASVTSSTSLNNSDGIFIGNDLIDAQGGTISLNGMAGYYFNNDPTLNAVSAGTGLHIDHSVIQTSGTSSITLTGDASMPTTGSTVPTGTFNGSATQIAGVGIYNNSAISTDQGNILVTGTINSGEGTGQSAPLHGIDISQGTIIGTHAVGLSPAGSLTLIGDTSGSISTNNDNTGVNINGYDSSSSTTYFTLLSAGNGGSINITGTSGTINLDSSATNNSNASGVEINQNVSVTATGSAPITIIGTGGTDNDTSGTNRGSSHGVALTADKGGSVAVSAGSGAITVTGTSGASPNEGLGVLVSGANGFSTTVQSTAGNILITGIGGSGYTGTGVIVNKYVPDYGIVMADNILIKTQGTGTISLTGTGGANSYGVGIEQLPAGNGFDSNPVRPTIIAGGAFNATALADTGIFLNASVTAASANLGTETGTPVITSGQLLIANSNIILGGGNFIAYGAGVVPDQDGINILKSTINTQGGMISLVGQQAGTNNVYGVNVRTSSTLNAGSGALDITTLGGSGIWLNATVTAQSATLGSGSTGNPASVTTGSLQIENSNLTLSGGDLTGYGAGTSSSVDGVDFYGSSLNTQGGNIFLTGRGGYYFNGSAPAPGNEAGWGVFVGVNSVLETSASNQSFTTGNISITGDGSQSITAINDLTGVEIYNSQLSVVDGAISVIGNVNSGTSQNISNMYVSYTSGVGDGPVGVLVDGGSNIAASGTGSVSLVGNTTGSVSDASGSTVANHDNSGVHITGQNTTIAANGGGITIIGNSGSIINNSGSGASTALDVSIGPFQSSGIPTLNAGTGSLIIDPAITGNGINVVANITAGTTTLSDPGQEVDVFNNGSSDFGILNLIANTATIYQVASINLGVVSVNNLTLITKGNITQTGSLITSLLSAAAGGSITLTNSGNSITQLGPINQTTGVTITSGGTPLVPTMNNISQNFALNVRGTPYTINLNQVNNIPALGITIQPIGNQTPNIGGGTITGQQVATVLPVNNQVAPNPPSFDTSILILDTSTLGSDIGYNPQGGNSPIFQSVSTLSGASSGDSDVGPDDVVEVGDGSVSSTKMPPAVAGALQGALNNQVRQDLSTALHGH
jgi:filamentous hemagglutinin family protein